MVDQALDELEIARAQEGQAMAEELKALGRSGRGGLERIADRGPLVVQSYQKRLIERIAALVQDQGVTVEPKDLIREVAILADRSDISEEIVRLRAHLLQYQELLDEPGKCRAEARVRGPGDRPRNQHGRVQGQRRRDQPSGSRDQESAGEESGNSFRMWSDCEDSRAGG